MAGINHGAFVNVGADVNVGRHQHSVAGDERATAHGGRRHHAETFFLKTRFVVVSEFHRHFIEVAAFRTIDNRLSLIRKESSTAFFSH